MMHGWLVQCQTYPATGHYCPLTGTKVYCLVTEAHWHTGVNNLPKVVTYSGMTGNKVQHPNHYTTRPHKLSNQHDKAETPHQTEGSAPRV